MRTLPIEKLLEAVGDARLVLLGEASHGTHEFYRIRAIGVIYRPESERFSHYFEAKIAAQFDAVIHIDETSALQPLEAWAHEEVDLPETYPSGV